MSTEATPCERIQSLLKIHGGHCFIVASCEDFTTLEAEARQMESEGLCKVTESKSAVAGLNIKRKGYSAKRFAPLEPETPAH